MIIVIIKKITVLAIALLLYKGGVFAKQRTTLFGGKSYNYSIVPFDAKIINKLGKSKRIKPYYPKHSIFISKPYLSKLYDADSRKFVSYRFKNMNFRLFIPKDIRTENLPLLTYYHGSSMYGKDNIAQVCGSIKTTASEEFQSKNPCFVLAPQCPKDQIWTRKSLENVIDLIKELKNVIPEIDANRKYIMGHSLGGYGVCHTIKNYPDFFAAAVPMGGAISSGFKPEHSMPIMAVYNGGELDVIKNSSKQLISAFKRFGSDAKLRTFLFGGHKDTVNYALNDNKVISWLFSKEKSSPVSDRTLSLSFADNSLYDHKNKKKRDK